jgi:hypothetical protein
MPYTSGLARCLKPPPRSGGKRCALTDLILKCRTPSGRNRLSALGCIRHAPSCSDTPPASATVRGPGDFPQIPRGSWPGIGIMPARVPSRPSPARPCNRYCGRCPSSPPHHITSSTRWPEWLLVTRASTQMGRRVKLGSTGGASRR